MDAARLRDAGCGGAQVQVVGVGEDDFCLDVLQLGGGYRLDGGFGAYRHKNRRGYVAVVGVYHAQTGLGFLGCL